MAIVTLKAQNKYVPTHFSNKKNIREVSVLADILGLHAVFKLKTSVYCI